MNEEIKFQSKMMMLRPNDLEVDRRYQRPLPKARAKQMAAELDPSGIGTIHVSIRADGTKWVIDGQTRREALKIAGLGDKPVRCAIYEGLTVQQEAHVFRILNRTRKTSAADDFRAGLSEGDPECLRIADICKKNGFTVSEATDAGKISCVVELRAIYRRPDGPRVLGAALNVVSKAWPGVQSAGEKTIVGGVARLIAKHPESVDTNRLIHVLSKYGGGPTKIISQARWVVENTPGRAGISEAASEVILGIYNTGLRTGRIAS